MTVSFCSSWFQHFITWRTLKPCKITSVCSLLSAKASRGEDQIQSCSSRLPWCSFLRVDWNPSQLAISEPRGAETWARSPACDNNNTSLRWALWQTGNPSIHITSKCRFTVKPDRTPPRWSDRIKQTWRSGETWWEAQSYGRDHCTGKRHTAVLSASYSTSVSDPKCTDCPCTVSFSCNAGGELCGLSMWRACERPRAGTCSISASRTGIFTSNFAASGVCRRNFKV